MFFPFRVSSSSFSVFARRRFSTSPAACSFLRYINMSQDSPPSNAVPFNYQAGPLVWIDCEMTGLDPQTDRLLEIAVIVTNGNLQRVDSGINYVIRTNKTVLDSMDPWCINQHGQSGLTQACLSSPHSLDYVSSEVLAYIKKWIPDRSTGVLAGNTVYMDRLFLAKEMPEVVDWLHYRIVDVSSIKELVRRWYTGKIAPKFGDNGHRALDDIECSIKELQWYKDNIFVQQSLKNGGGNEGERGEKRKRT